MKQNGICGWAVWVLAIGAVFAGVSAGGLDAPSAIAATITSDQAFWPPPNLNANISEGYSYVGQTVTAGMTGYLARVDLYVYRFHADMSTPWEVTIRSVSNGVPTGSILASELLPSSSAPLSTESPHRNMIVNFDTSAFIEAGETFAIVIRSPGATEGGGHAVGGWGGSVTIDYPRGRDWFSHDGTSFTASSGDLDFGTYVSVPEPSSCAMLLMGASGLLVSRRRASHEQGRTPPPPPPARRP